ncbi:MAG: polysaccharide deacetylase family protein [Deltaproteobacteria bacterium]|nr:polysaccharide deacetylase family protein [Deltaproteobacteria bacterium]
MGRFYGSLIIFLFLAAVGLFLFTGAARTLVLLILLIAYLILFSLGVSVLRLNFFCRAVCRGKTGHNKVALTFDDGPDPETTPAVLSVLAKYGIKAAFFCIGKKAAKHPEITQRIVNEGHIIANHGYSHFWWTNFKRFAGLHGEMAKAQESIKSATGKTPAFFRPLAGLSNPHIGKALEQNSLICIGWDVRPFDTVRTNKQVFDAVLRKTRDGSIILLHDTARSSQDMTELLEDLIVTLKERGFSFSALDELLGIDPYLDEQAGKNAAVPANILQRLSGRLAETGFIKKAVTDDVTPEALRQRPSLRFIAGISLIGISYIIGWPAVAFFAMLAVYLKREEIVLLGPASYILSHFVFIAGAVLAGIDGVRYMRVFMRLGMHKFALWLTKNG